MNDQIFELYMKEVFLPWTASFRASKRLFLLFDNFGSHVTPAVLKLAAKNNIVVVGLPAHSSHILQPLDVSVCGPLKQHYSNAVAAWQAADTNVVGRVIDAKQAILMLAKPYGGAKECAWNKALSRDNIMSGFKATGIFPLDPEKTRGKFPGASRRSPAAAPVTPAAPVSSEDPLGMLAEAASGISVVREVFTPPRVLQRLPQRTADAGPSATLLTAEEHLQQLEAAEAQKLAKEQEAADRKAARAAAKEQKQRELEEKQLWKRAEQFLVQRNVLQELDILRATMAERVGRGQPLRSWDQEMARRCASQRFLEKRRAAKRARSPVASSEN